MLFRGGFFCLLGFVLLCMTSAAPSDDPQGMSRADIRHPLDPLSAVEIRTVAQIVRRYNSKSDWQFKFIGLRDPDKDVLYPYFLSQTIPPATLIPRRANVLICDPVLRIPIWLIVNLSEFKVESWVESPGERIGVIMSEDNILTGQIALGNPDIQKRIKALEWEVADVIADVWDAGYVADNPNYAKANKLVQIFFYGMKGAGTNYNAHPLDFVAYVELGPNAIRGIENLPTHQGFDTSDHSGSPVPRTEYNFRPEQLPPSAINRNLNRLKISQPEGPSFKISGREVTWDNFKLRVGYNSREGPHLHTVTFNDKGVIRPVAYRLSISEVFLQYGDPRPPFHRKGSLEEGSWQFGSSCFSQPVHELCRGDAYYFQADLHTEKAESYIVQNSICVVEEDAGVLWAHYDDKTGAKTAVTRAQRLSISHLIAIAHTQYYISWRFYQDATIEFAVKMIGVINTNLMAIDVKAPEYGQLVAPQLYSQIYQHFFALRIDADVDGRKNTVSTEDIVRVKDYLCETNPYGNGMKIVENVLETPAEARTNILPTRVWKVSNPHKVQPVTGKPVAWKIVPQGNMNPPNLMTPDSPVRGRIPWTDHNMWVLPYDPDQIYASGKFYLSDGLATWTQQNASANIVDTDVVMWHVFNYVDNLSQDDFPVYSSNNGLLGFRLRPYGFFTTNPATTVQPASESTALDGRENLQACLVGAGIKPNFPGGQGWSK